MKITQFANLPGLKALNIVAVSSLAIGVATSISAAPAQAVLLNSGLLRFTDGTGDFFSSPAQTSYTVNFNPLGSALIGNATESFSTTFAANELRAITPSTGVFNLVAGNTFSLASALNFTFVSNGVTVSIAPGSTFTRNINNDFGVGFANLDVIGTVANADGTVNIQATAFTFGDTLNAGGGNYGIVISPINPTAAVPEPFTIIGTIIGGTAAFRMRKKLASKN